MCLLYSTTHGSIHCLIIYVCKSCDVVVFVVVVVVVGGGGGGGGGGGAAAAAAAATSAQLQMQTNRHLIYVSHLSPAASNPHRDVTL